MTGPTRSAGRAPGIKAGIDWDLIPLGQLADNELARRLGVAQKTVWLQRVARGLERYHPPQKPRTKGCWHKVAWDRATPALGTTWDVTIAETIGRSSSVVAQARAHRGIPTYSEMRACPCGEMFRATVRRQRVCSRLCGLVWASHLSYKGRPETAPVAVALAALKREIRHRGTR